MDDAYRIRVNDPGNPSTGNYNKFFKLLKSGRIGKSVTAGHCTDENLNSSNDAPGLSFIVTTKDLPLTLFSVPDDYDCRS